jgi:hypothetical protein
MKKSWTLSITALALVLGIFPAFAHQGQLPPPKSIERQQIDRKIDAASKTPFMTPHQGTSLKKALDGGERMKQDEKVTEPNPFQPGSQPGSQAKPGEILGNGRPDQNPEMQEQKEAPRAESAPAFRLMGTVCGKGADFAVFESGGDWPSMLKAGDKLPDGTLVVSVSRGKVCLEKVVMAAQPAVQGQPAQPAAGPEQPELPEVKARPAQPEKRERYELYAW